MPDAGVCKTLSVPAFTIQQKSKFCRSFVETSEFEVCKLRIITRSLQVNKSKFVLAIVTKPLVYADCNSKFRVLLSKLRTNFV